MFKSYYLVDFFQNQKWRYFDFEKNWLKNDQTLIKVKLRLKLVTCLIMTANLLLHMRQRATIGHYYISYTFLLQL